MSKETLTLHPLQQGGFPPEGLGIFTFTFRINPFHRWQKFHYFAVVNKKEETRCLTFKEEEIRL
ncbi:MAG: hypothetical protein IKW98_04105 [Prevotella sp.]|nr:hypothetical protein [Prevotella sp.]